MVRFSLLSADARWMGFAPQDNIMSARKFRQLEQSVFYVTAESFEAILGWRLYCLIATKQWFSKWATGSGRKSREFIYLAISVNTN